MKVILHYNKEKNDIFQIETNQNIYLYYSSVFDANTNEIDYISCEFNREDFINAIKLLNKTGSCSINAVTGYCGLYIGKNKEGLFEFLVGSANRTFSFFDKKFDPKLIENILTENNISIN